LDFHCTKGLFELMAASLLFVQVLEDEEEAALEKEDQEREQEVS